MGLRPLVTAIAAVALVGCSEQAPHGDDGADVEACVQRMRDTAAKAEANGAPKVALDYEAICRNTAGVRPAMPVAAAPPPPPAPPAVPALPACPSAAGNPEDPSIEPAIALIGRIKADVEDKLGAPVRIDKVPAASQKSPHAFDCPECAAQWVYGQLYLGPTARYTVRNKTIWFDRSGAVAGFSRMNMGDAGYAPLVRDDAAWMNDMAEQQLFRIRDVAYNYFYFGKCAGKRAFAQIACFPSLRPNAAGDRQVVAPPKSIKDCNLTSVSIFDEGKVVSSLERYPKAFPPASLDAPAAKKVPASTPGDTCSLDCTCKTASGCGEGMTCDRAGAFPVCR